MLLLDEEAALVIKKGWARLVTLDDAAPVPAAVPKDTTAMAHPEEV
jgi:hypothetical protein